MKITKFLSRKVQASILLINVLIALCAFTYFNEASRINDILRGIFTANGITIKIVDGRYSLFDAFILFEIDRDQMQKAVRLMPLKPYDQDQPESIRQIYVNELSLPGFQPHVRNVLIYRNMRSDFSRRPGLNFHGMGYLLIVYDKASQKAVAKMVFPIN